jgi:tetratricopeptide (TPR) repeat protein
VPAPAESPYPGNVSYPPYPNYQYSGQVQLDFDANRIADARLIRTLPLSQPEMNSLEIQFRGAYDLYVSQRYYEAFEAFMRQTSYAGNYLSPYWAGMSALRIGDRQTAITLFNNALAINPYYEPARGGLLTANGTIPEQPRPQAPRPVRRSGRQ